MIVYPAVDIMNSKCVRLKRGEPGEAKSYFDKPFEAAKWWEEQGAQYLHVVDLDGAMAGKPKNLSAVEEIVSRVKIPVQLGGGLRDTETLDRIFDIGVKRAILGTAVIAQPEVVAQACLKYPERIAGAIDARSGKVAIEGWRKGTELEVLEVVDEFKLLGVKRLIYTDITSDGTLEGVNLEDVRQMVRAIDVPVIVSGGVSSLDDLREIKQLEVLGIEGVIIGTALYEGSFTLKEAIGVAGTGNAS